MTAAGLDGPPDRLQGIVSGSRERGQMRGRKRGTERDDGGRHRTRTTRETFHRFLLEVSWVCGRPINTRGLTVHTHKLPVLEFRTQKPCFVYDWLGQWAPAGRFDNSSEKGRSKTTLLRTPKGPPVNHNCSRQGRQTHRNNVVLSFLSRRGRGRSRHTWDDTKAAHLLIYECTSTSAKYLGYGASTGRRSIRHSGMSFRSSHGRVVRCSCRPSQANKRWSSES